MEKQRKTKKERESGIQRFIERWSGSHKEDEEARSFLIELMQDVLGQSEVTHRINFEKKVRIDGRTKRIDAYLPETKTVIEMKSSHIDMDHTNRDDYPTAFAQAKTYYDNLRWSDRGRFVITSNFHQIWIYDLQNPDSPPEKLLLENLEQEAEKLKILINPEFTTVEAERIRTEQKLSVEAGDRVGILYNLLLKQYGQNPEENQLRELNMLIVRLVFCLYAEDAGLFEENQFHDFLMEYPSQTVHLALEELFKVLNTAHEKRKIPYLTPAMVAFEYVNGGLFQEKIRIPMFTPEIYDCLVRSMSEEFDWSGISPTIFGAVFESTLNPQTRSSGGMHYTSIENIHKVIDPLFLDQLKAELNEIEAIKVPSRRKVRLQAFQNSLSQMRFFDPACGSGNFLTESYLSLRRLENRAISLLPEEVRGGFQLGFDMDTIQVQIQQFYGIEINDFAVSVATTAMYIAEAQMYQETKQILAEDSLSDLAGGFLPLRSYSNIHEGNALITDWKKVFPQETTVASINGFKKTFIMGNPPFLGYSMQSAAQKKELRELWKDPKGKPYSFAGKIDYVSGWYLKAAQYMAGTDAEAAFVSTNSIAQGDQVGPIWNVLSNRYGIEIQFAYPSFVWQNQAASQAHVHCVIIGFSRPNPNRKILFTKTGPEMTEHISPYLTAGKNIFIEKRSKPLSAPLPMVTGNRPADGGHLILEEEDYAAFISREPRAKKYIKKLTGSAEYLRGKNRWCLWLVDASPAEIKSMPLVHQRVEACRQDRLDAVDEGRKKLALRPHLFRETENPSRYLLIPRVSSERREYIPIGFLDDQTIPTDAAVIIPGAGYYHFGILESSVHMAWMRMVAGRLKSDYRYSKDIVYNNFPWPSPDEETKKKIEMSAQEILAARSNYPDSSLADLYDSSCMPQPLRKAHMANDKAVIEAYGMDQELSESEIVEYLFKLYRRMTSQSK